MEQNRQMEKTTNIGFEQVVEQASPEQLYNNELVLIRLEEVDMEAANTVILPIQFEGYSAIVITKGASTVIVDYMPYNISKGMVLELISHNSIQNFTKSSDLEGYHLFTTKDFFIFLMSEFGPPPPNVMNLLRQNPITQPDDKSFKLLTGALERLNGNIVKKDHYYQHGLIMNEVRNFMMELRDVNIKKYSGVQPNVEYGRYEELLISFIKLLIQHCKEKHDVAFYSTELCVTPVYLSRAVKALSGKTAMTWISDSLTIEAKLMLRKPNVTIQHIAEELHFSDQSSFGKFFKKHTGMSPVEYRQSIIGS